MIQAQSTNRGVVSRCAVALVASSLLVSSSALAETWTSLRGNHSVDAKMVGLWSGSVILQLSNGRRVTVKLDDLRSESRIQAQELARQLASSRTDRINSLKGQATAAAAPAPDPLPVPPAAPQYVPPQPNQSCANFFSQYDQAIASGHILAIYDSLPPSFRQDINEIVKVSTQRMDPAIWYNLLATIQRLGDLMETRQRWFVSSPRIQALPAEQIEMAEGPLMTLAGLLRVGLDQDAMQLDKLQSMDFRQWLAERDQAVAPYLAQLFQQLGTDLQREVAVESERDGVAIASIDIGGSKKKVTYVWIEGYWVPKTLADQWPATAQSWKQAPETNFATSMMAASLLLQPIAPSLDAMANATDAGAYHSAMESVLTPAETILPSIAAMLGKNMNLAGRGNSNSSYDGGYEDGYGDDMSSDYAEDMDMDLDDSGDDMSSEYDGGMAGAGYDGE